MDNMWSEAKTSLMPGCRSHAMLADGKWVQINLKAHIKQFFFPNTVSLILKQTCCHFLNCAKMSLTNAQYITCTMNWIVLLKELAEMPCFFSDRINDDWNWWWCCEIQQFFGSWDGDHCQKLLNYQKNKTGGEVAGIPWSSAHCKSSFMLGQPSSVNVEAGVVAGQ